MKESLEKRTLNIAKYMIHTKDTIRGVAETFGLSKSIVHKDLHQRLSILDKEKYEQVKNILYEHQKMRHIKGGISTKKKYLKLKEELIIEERM